FACAGHAAVLRSLPLPDALPIGAQEIVLAGQPELSARAVKVPADPSSAAFPLVAALLLPGSEVRLTAVGMNPQRIGLIITLQERSEEHTSELQSREHLVCRLLLE